MGIKSFLFSLLLILTACATQNPQPSEVSNRRDSHLSPKSATPEQTKFSEKPAPRIGVILSPGGARTFAQLGALTELLKARIPIEAIVGVEWGSLVGALYAQNGQIHEAEWKLYKLETHELTSHSIFGSRKPEAVKNLEGFFNENLRSRSISQSAIRFACPTLSVWSGAFQWQDRGEFSDALKKCLPSPPILKPSGPWAAALISARDSAVWLRRQGINVVVLINVLKSPDDFEQERMLDDFTLATLYHEMRRSFSAERDLIDEVIDIDTRGYKVLDFEMRKDLVLLGERIGRGQAEMIAKKYGF